MGYSVSNLIGAIRNGLLYSVGVSECVWELVE